MTTLLEEVKNYEAPQHTMNIADLQSVSIDMELKTHEDVDKEGKPYTYKYIEVEGKKYRVPSKVIGDLKTLMLRIPDLKHFYVIKSGEGKEGTKYQVVPLQN